MDNNGKGRGIFYGVIGVATLVVAIIGATFAYFSASISSNANSIYTQAANITLAITEDPQGIKTGIVPIDEHTNHTAFATGGYVGANTSVLAADSNNCIDVDGNPFCSIFTFTISNPSTAAQTVYARMDVDYNYFDENTPNHSCQYEEGTGAVIPGSCTTCDYLGYSTSKELNNNRQVTDVKNDNSDKSGHDVYCGNSNIAFAIFKGDATLGANADDTTASASQITNWNILKAVTTKYEAKESGATGYNATTEGNVIGTEVTGALGDLVVSRTAVPEYDPAVAAARNSDEDPNNNIDRPSFQFNALTQTLKPGGSVTYTVLVWLHENWQNQEDDEAMTFGAGITFSTSQGGSGVTARLTA